LLPGVTEEAQLGVDQASQPLGVPKREGATARPDVVRGELAGSVGELAFERQLTAGSPGTPSSSAERCWRGPAASTP
jgi:hypothetical protein